MFWVLLLYLLDSLFNKTTQGMFRKGEMGRMNTMASNTPDSTLELQFPQFYCLKNKTKTQITCPCAAKIHKLNQNQTIRSKTIYQKRQQITSERKESLKHQPQTRTTLKTEPTFLLPSYQAFKYPLTSFPSTESPPKTQEADIPYLIIREVKLKICSGGYMQSNALLNKKLQQISVQLDRMPGKNRSRLLTSKHKSYGKNRPENTTKQMFTQDVTGVVGTQAVNNCNILKHVKPRIQKSVQKIRNYKITSVRSQSLAPKRPLRQFRNEYEPKQRPFDPPKKISAKSYIIYRLESSQLPARVMLESSSKSKQQIASLTKIMTAILILQISKIAGIDKYAQEIEITEYEESINGTSAEISAGEIYTVQQLLYGLMLPSGNDASVALAAWAGNKLRSMEGVQTENSNKSMSNYSDDSLIEKRQRGYNRFIQEMNNKARQLKMKKTVYMNSHGLSNSQSRSCAYDQIILCEYAMKNQVFRELVRTVKYSGYIKYIYHSLNFNSSRSNQGNSLYKKVKVQWQNTHDLLRRFPQEYIGIKTGFTYTAGPCLASCVRIEKKEYLIVVLGCESHSMRFRDTQNLKKWCASKVMAEKIEETRMEGKIKKKGFFKVKRGNDSQSCK